MYGRSSEHNFPLAEFNLGRIQMKNEKPEESIKYYIRASEHEDEPLIYRGITRDDLRLKISKTFVICLTNLILVEHYFSLNEYKESRKYFIRSLKKLEINTKELKYKFEMKIELKDEPSENCSSNAFSYLKKFILNFPKFKLALQQNLKDKPYTSLFEQNNNKGMENEKETKFKSEQGICKEIEFSTDQINKEKEFKTQEEKSSKFSIQSNEKDNNFNRKKFLLFSENIDLISKFNESDEKASFSIKECPKEKKQDPKVKIFDKPRDLFDFITRKSDSKSESTSKAESNSKPKTESKLKTIFINEIRDIISIMNDILYTEPYQILFGRITIQKPKEKEEKQEDRREVIDQSFYDGFYNE